MFVASGVCCMKIALLGYGKMGKRVEALAESMGVSVVSRLGREKGDLLDAEVCIDFSHGDAVLEHAKACANLGKSLVIGTTGWESSIEAVRELAQGIGIFYAPNFSLGVHLFLKILKEASDLISPFTEYKAGICEWHHEHKKDAPSGTALEMQRHMKGRVGIVSSRLGSIPGTHMALFDGPDDTITLQHTARSRDGFARGALEAALWLRGKRGFYTLDDYLELKNQSCRLLT